MGILYILLCLYLITFCISIYFGPIKEYQKQKEKLGKRKALLESISFGFFCLIPYVIFYVIVEQRLKEWFKDDPTSPENMNNPNFVPPPKKKKVKKEKPIKSRFEIIDI